MKQDLPRGWTEEEIRALAEYYDSRSDDEAIAEAEAAYADPNSAMVQVPHQLLPDVLRLLAGHESKQSKKARRK